MDVPEFNSSYLKKLSEDVSGKQKPISLLRDLNVNLLNYNEHNLLNESLHS